MIMTAAKGSRKLWPVAYLGFGKTGMAGSGGRGSPFGAETLLAFGCSMEAANLPIFGNL